MFDQLATQLTNDRAACPDMIAPELENNQLFAQIVSRLENEVPPGLYVPDGWLAHTLGITLKTLINRRGNKTSTYPRPLHLAGGQGGMHVRSDLIDWLAREELRARTRRAHKCQ